MYDTYTWIEELQAFIRSVLAADIPLVGICFGHQLIAQTLGGKVRLSDNGWMLGLHDVWVHTTKDWMCDASHSHPLYFVNQDQVVELPPGVELLGGSDNCPNAMYGIDNKLFSLQPHPEQSQSSIRAFTEDIVERYKLDASVSEEAYRTMRAAEPDAKLVAEWITAFLQSAHSSTADS